MNYLVVAREPEVTPGRVDPMFAGLTPLAANADPDGDPS